jgi:solute carrier family 10 (sodium/bile acid cotransporter), member 3/5
MCPLFYLLLLTLFIAPLFLLCSSASTLQATFNPSKLEIKIDAIETVQLQLQSTDIVLNEETDVQIKSEHDTLAKVVSGDRVKFINIKDNVWLGEFNVTGVFLGFTRINVSVAEMIGDSSLPVVITRPKRAIDTIFTVSIITLVSLLYINFGAAVDVTVVKGILRRPIGPLIGFLGQFLFMPLVN